MITYEFFIEDIDSEDFDKNFCALVGLVYMGTYNAEYVQGARIIKVKVKCEDDVALDEILNACSRFGIEVKYRKI